MLELLVLVLVLVLVEVLLELLVDAPVPELLVLVDVLLELVDVLLELVLVDPPVPVPLGTQLALAFASTEQEYPEGHPQKVQSPE